MVAILKNQMAAGSGPIQKGMLSLLQYIHFCTKNEKCTYL